MHHGACKPHGNLKRGNNKRTCAAFGKGVVTIIDVLLYIVVSWEMLFLSRVVTGEKEKAQYNVFSFNLALTGSYRFFVFFFYYSCLHWYSVLDSDWSLETCRLEVLRIICFGQKSYILA